MSDNQSRYLGSCMEFTMDEIKEHLIARFENQPGVDLAILSDGEMMDLENVEQIDGLCFDGLQQEIAISFYGIQTSLYIKDKEIMFIDDEAKRTYTSEDVEGNAVYEGRLRQMSHPEILGLLGDMIDCFIGTRTVDLKAIDLPKEAPIEKIGAYKPKAYNIHAKKKTPARLQKSFENILIQY